MNMLELAYCVSYRFVAFPAIRQNSRRFRSTPFRISSSPSVGGTVTEVLSETQCGSQGISGLYFQSSSALHTDSVVVDRILPPKGLRFV